MKINAPQSNSKELIIAILGGGSRGWAWGLMSDLALQGELNGCVRLFDIDPNAVASNAQIGSIVSRGDSAGTRWRYEVTHSLSETLRGADVVVTSITPGSWAAMSVDVHTPSRWGIWQTVGDTVGPAGIMRAARTIPMFRAFAHAIAEHAPKAPVINYTNPMTLCTRTLFREFPGAHAMGWCHEVKHVRRFFAQIAETMLSIPRPDASEFEIEVGGINHFTWITRATFRGEDFLPLYGSFAEKHFETEFHPGGDLTAWESSVFSTGHRVKMDLFRRHGVIAAAGDRHLAEFLPPDHYLTNPETIHRWQMHLTPVSWRIDNDKAARARQQRLANAEEAFDLQGSGEDGMEILHGLMGIRPFETTMNLPNRGQAVGLPLDAVVETVATVDADGARAHGPVTLPASVLDIVRAHVRCQEAVLEAVFAEDEGELLEAFLLDPSVQSLGRDEGIRLFNTMVDEIGELGEWPFDCGC